MKAMKYYGVPACNASTASLERLLSETRVGHDEYEEVIARSSQRLLALTRTIFRGYNRLRRWEDTGDVCQLATLRLWRSLQDVRPETLREFMGLAATQIRRTLIDLSRHHFGPQGSARFHHTDVYDLQAGREIAVVQASGKKSTRPESLAEWTEFHQAVEALREEQREVFQLIWYTGLEQSEVACMLQCSVPTVQRRWYAAQLSLARMLHDMPATEE